MRNAFHNTINIQQPELALYEEKAKKQDELILDIFKERADQWLTPFQVEAIVRFKTGKNYPITSIRRSITNMTKRGDLLKSCEASKKGIYNMPNHCWTFNRVA
jgi:hypothetical protein